MIYTDKMSEFSGNAASGLAGYGAKPPFLGISAYGGKANLPVIRLDL
jgi:hypothetical protein